MGEVVDFNPAARLVAGMRSELEESGSIQRSVRELAELGVDPGQWRTAARRAARQLGRPVQTGQGDLDVWAVLRDWPATEPERAQHQQQLRRAVEAVSQPLDPT